MAKILSISDDKVEIGEDNGALVEVRPSDLSFVPRVGDVVDVFRSENSVRVTLADKQTATRGGPVTQDGGGININLTQAQEVTAPPVAATYVQAGKVVNKLAYILCACLLGGLGVHKFIAGKVGMGILYIVFMWTFIPALVGLIEGLVAIGKTADANGNIIV